MALARNRVDARRAIASLLVVDARRTVASLLFASTLMMTSRAHAADPDPWFGRDKALHFSVSAAIAGTGYALAATQFDARYPPLLVGGGVALAAGAGKETLDLLGSGDPSWRDFAWDVAGTVVGLGVAWGLDLLLRGVSHHHPAFGNPEPAQPAAQASQLRVQPFTGLVRW